MPIDENLLKNFGGMVIIAHCLQEMTHAGFEQVEIQLEIGKIKNIKNEYDSPSLEKKE